MGTFETLAHTADVGFRARGESLDDLFATAAVAMLSVEYDPASVELAEERPVTAAGDDLEATMFAWLSELIWLHDAGSFAPGRVRAEVRAGSAEDPGGFEVDGWAEGAPMGDWFVQAGPQLKAVTLHQLTVAAVDGGYEATVYLDV
ncbi:MAG TPA: archease [Actinomycetota bacterium]|nr:archease [Actinomycetota bacterium]